MKSAALGLLIALAIILRLFGPAGTVTTLKDGYVAICLGAEIVYIKASELGVQTVDGQEAPDQDSHKAEPCLWFGGFHPLTLAFSALAATQSTDHAVRFPSPKDQHVNRPTRLSVHARAPPHLSQLKLS
ncbi:hypothetical protein [Paracoccus amoyensis]|uniref:hypothetical protein n=1 Tax=Paracoccus amoyensis TaxID=2760093 RepID=UPI001658FFEA|nr:hypothetical protein [Paracoccus amoyensis]